MADTLMLQFIHDVITRVPMKTWLVGKFCLICLLACLSLSERECTCAPVSRSSKFPFKEYNARQCG